MNNWKNRQIMYKLPSASLEDQDQGSFILPMHKSHLYGDVCPWLVDSEHQLVKPQDDPGKCRSTINRNLMNFFVWTCLPPS